MLNGALSFLIRNMKEKVIIKDGIRTNIYEYPVNALREAIMNALIHRDYTYLKERSYISVFKYSDRIEICSPGSLYGSNKIDTLGVNDKVETRNPTIINLLENIDDFVENRNTGIWTIRREMNKYKMPEPEFVNLRGAFKVILKNKNYETCSSNEQVSGTQIENSGTQIENSGTQKIDSLIEFCKNPRTAKEIKEYLKLSSRWYVSQKIIKPLVENGTLIMTNSNLKNAKNQKYITKSKEVNNDFIRWKKS